MAAYITVSKTIGVSAFHDSTLVMNCSLPMALHYICVKELQEWLITLEEIIPKAPTAHRYHLEQLFCSLKSAYNTHLREHEAIVTEAPTAEDLQEYLVAYAAAIGHGTLS